MKKRTLWFPFLTFFLSTPLFAQTGADSLEARLRGAVGTERVEALTALVEAYRSNDPARALGYGREALALLKTVPDPRRAAKVLYWMGAAHVKARAADSVLVYADRIDALAASAGDAKGRADAAYLRARANHETRHYEQSLAYAREALSRYRAAGDARGTANANSYVGLVFYELKRYDEAIPFLERALAQHEALGDRMGVGNDLIRIGLVHEGRHDYEQALSFYERSLEVREAIGDLRGMGWALNNIGVVHHREHKYAEALGFHQRAFEVREAVGDRDGMARSLINIGNDYSVLQQYEEALRVIRRARLIREALGDRKGTARSIHWMGIVYEQMGEYEKALTFYLQALEIQEAIGDHNGLQRSFSRMGRVYRKISDANSGLGAYEEALTFHLRHLALREELYAEHPSDDSKDALAMSLHQAGTTLRALGRYDEALALDLRALALWEELGDPFDVGGALQELGELHAAMGNHEEALALELRALALWEEVFVTHSNMGLLLRSIARSRIELGLYADALATSRRLVALGRATDPLYLRDGYENLARIHEALAGQALAPVAGAPGPEAALSRTRAALAHTRAALVAYKRFKAVNDSLFSTDSRGVIAELQAQYRTKEQQKNIELLEREAQIQAAWRYGLFGGLALLLFIAALLYNRYRLKNRAHRALSAAHDRVREHEAQLEVQAVKLRELDEMKSRFFANISHELRTPLTLIRGQVEDVRDARFGPIPHNAARHLDASLSQTRRLQRLVEELLDLSRLQSSRMRLAASRHDLDAFLRRLTGLFSSLAHKHEITLTYEGAHDALPVYFDADKLEKVVTNLIGNALKFTEAGGHVTVALEVPAGVEDESGAGAFAVVRVTDTGMGIASSELPKVFERFYQVDASSTRRFGGMGVGLALVKELVELHGGAIAVESVEREGTTFTLSLPLGREHLSDEELVEAGVSVSEVFHAGSDDFIDVPLGGDGRSEVVAADETSGETSESASRMPTVLVVEDNAELRAYLREHLCARYRVVEAEDGREGLEKARAERPELVVSDVMMPRMDGFALLRALKRDEALRTAPVILLTARAGTEDRLKGLGAQADDYLAKPFHMAELEGRIANLIAMRRAMRRVFGPEQVTVTARALELPSEAAAFLEQAQEVIEAHVSDRGFNVQALAEALYVSKRALERRMREMTGHAPAAYIRQVRLDRARQMLEGGQVTTVREASQAVGFGNQGYFARLYRNAYGQSPAALVRQGVERSSVVDAPTDQR